MTMCHEMLVSPVLRQQLMAHVASLPEAANKVLKGLNPMLMCVCCQTGKWSSAEQLKELFRGGSANPKIEVTHTFADTFSALRLTVLAQVVELVTALHPARFFVPLYTPAYGVIARERIENGGMPSPALAFLSHIVPLQSRSASIPGCSKWTLKRTRAPSRHIASQCLYALRLSTFDCPALLTRPSGERHGQELAEGLEDRCTRARQRASLHQRPARPARRGMSRHALCMLTNM
jgi:hypothetical protein